MHINKIQKHSKLVSNYIWLIVLAPLYIKTGRLHTPPIVMMLVSWVVWAHIVFFVVGIALSIFGIQFDLQGSVSDQLLASLSDNPMSVFGWFFWFLLLLLLVFYGYAILYRAWDRDAINKHIEDGTEKEDQS